MVGRPVTSQEKMAVKKMLDAKMARKDIAEIMGLSLTTIKRISCEANRKKEEQATTKNEKTEQNQNEKILLAKLVELISLQKETNVLLKELTTMYKYDNGYSAIRRTSNDL